MKTENLLTSNQSTIIGVAVFFLILFVYLPQLTNAEPDICSLCICNSGGVFCSSNTEEESKLSRLPSYLSAEYPTLIMIRQKFKTPYITQTNMTGLKYLESLQINGCGLKSIDSHTFIGMTRLKFLILSDNPLKVIQAETFKDLVLNSLTIKNSYQLGLNRESFVGLSTPELMLKNISLRTLDYNIFKKVDKLSKLNLFMNSITNVDLRFKTLFQNTLRVLDLSNNPLECDCTLDWFRDQISVHQDVGSQESRCNSPERFKGKKLIDLKKDDLVCPSRITTVAVDLRPPQAAELTCLAEGKLAPSIKWTYHEGAHVRSVEMPSSVSDNDQAKSNISRLAFNTTISTTMKDFTCTAWVIKEMAVDSVIIRLRGPPPQKIPDKSNTASDEARGKDDNPTGSQVNTVPSPATKTDNLIYRRQFTLLDMIIAVVSTFVLSLVLLCGISYCIRKCKRRVKSEPPRRNNWGTIGSSCSATGSHEYDIPRPDLFPPPPPIPMYRPVDQIEFFDYKTQQKMYK